MKKIFLLFILYGLNIYSMRKSLISANYLLIEAKNKNHSEIPTRNFQPPPEDIDDSLPWDLREKLSNPSKKDLYLLTLDYEKTKQGILLAFWDPS